MIPILYECGETDFVSNGLCRLYDVIDCTVTEEKNGIYECAFSMPVTGAHYSEVIPGRIIGVTHEDSEDIQPFDIISYSRGIDGITSFQAVHISYRLNFETVTGSNISSLTDALNLLSGSGTRFSFMADFTSSAYMAEADGLPHTIRKMLGGAEGSILDAYGGEYTWDKWTVMLRKERGINRNFTIRYGVNMTEFVDEMDCGDTYNAVIPYYSGNDTNIIGNKQVASQPTFSGLERCIPLDLTDKFSTVPTRSGVETEGMNYLNSNQPYLPRQSLTVSFLRLQDYGEGLADLMQCGLCDRVQVAFPDYGMLGQYKIVKTVWDVLENRYIEMELGALQPTLKQAMGIK